MAWSVEERPEHLEAVLELKPALVSLSFGDYAPYVATLQKEGIVVAMQAGTVADAREAIDAGVDVIVARGAEAGGHGRNAVATLPLLQAILDLTDCRCSRPAGSPVRAGWPPYSPRARREAGSVRRS